jgi:hypothetical protein
MTTWTTDELARVAEAYELDMITFRKDGTPRASVSIRVVRVGDDLDVRSWRERDGARFRAALGRREGHIRAGGVEKGVTLVEECDPGINDEIDAAYRTKYRRSAPYVTPMISPDARAATLKLIFR